MSSWSTTVRSPSCSTVDASSESLVMEPADRRRRVMRRALRFARCVGAVGFVTARWLAAVCNVAALCGWLDVASLLFAAIHAAAFAGSPTACGSPVLGRRVARLLVLTCALNLASAGLDAIGFERFAWRTGFHDALDLLAWGWALHGVLAVARWLWGGDSVSPAGAVRPVALRHVSLSMVIVLGARAPGGGVVAGTVRPCGRSSTTRCTAPLRGQRSAPCTTGSMA